MYPDILLFLSLSINLTVKKKAALEEDPTAAFTLITK